MKVLVLLFGILTTVSSCILAANWTNAHNGVVTSTVAAKRFAEEIGTWQRSNRLEKPNDQALNTALDGFGKDPRIEILRTRLIAAAAAHEVYMDICARDEKIAYSLGVVWLAFAVTGTMVFRMKS